MALATDFTFAFNVPRYSNHILKVRMVREFEAAIVKIIHINSAILAAKSRFFNQLFSNGMKETDSTEVTVSIKDYEEEAFMELLRFIYTNSLDSSSDCELVHVLMIADKFEVESCVKYCTDKLSNIEMSLKSAFLYVNLHSKVLMPSVLQPLVEHAKQFLISRYRDIFKNVKEVLQLPLDLFAGVIADDALHAPSEDHIFDLVLKYVRKNYSSVEDRQNILETRLMGLIRFHYMSCGRIKDVLTFPEFQLKSIYKLVIEALICRVEMPAAAATLHRPRNYMCPQARVVEFDLSRPECVVYLDLKREECLNMFPTGKVPSQPFIFNQQSFYLLASCNMDQNLGFHCLGLSLGRNFEKEVQSCSVDIVFSARTKPSEQFEDRYARNRTFSVGHVLHRSTAGPSNIQSLPWTEFVTVGHNQHRHTAGTLNLLNVPWTEFVADDSKSFINDTLHLRAELKIRR